MKGTQRQTLPLWSGSCCRSVTTGARLSLTELLEVGLRKGLDSSSSDANRTGKQTEFLNVSDLAFDMFLQHVKARMMTIITTRNVVPISCFLLFLSDVGDVWRWLRQIDLKKDQIKLINDKGVNCIARWKFGLCNLFPGLLHSTRPSQSEIRCEKCFLQCSKQGQNGCEKLVFKVYSWKTFRYWQILARLIWRNDDIIWPSYMTS